jgi:hypothetical protein
MDEEIFRAAQAMIRNHGNQAERKAVQRAAHLESDEPRASTHWERVAAAIRTLMESSGRSGRG